MGVWLSVMCCAFWSLSESVGNYADVIFATLHLEERNTRTCYDRYQYRSLVCVTFSCRDAIRIRVTRRWKWGDYRIRCSFIPFCTPRGTEAYCMCGTFLTTKYRMGLRKGKKPMASTSKERWTAVSRKMLLERRNAGLTPWNKSACATCDQVPHGTSTVLLDHTATADTNDLGSSYQVPLGVNNLSCCSRTKAGFRDINRVNSLSHRICFRGRSDIWDSAAGGSVVGGGQSRGHGGVSVRISGCSALVFVLVPGPVVYDLLS